MRSFQTGAMLRAKNATLFPFVVYFYFINQYNLEVENSNLTQYCDFEDNKNSLRPRIKQKSKSFFRTYIGN